MLRIDISTCRCTLNRMNVLSSSYTIDVVTSLWAVHS